MYQISALVYDEASSNQTTERKKGGWGKEDGKVGVIEREGERIGEGKERERNE